ncbi:hypothetical protein [Actinomadura parmotrematis]|uniref:Alkaline shock response membrane anchor protein AmaP n=1 Tax=Actinomadura parmotrematis TaxID=2864039 RepID=A0ABS7FTS4_9ACTN|nr:hypothetical protein [Actinomadura parmotrematis]MBW8483808.1 hypothetical protein [Actinomadura parmotrematis]
MRTLTAVTGAVLAAAGAAVLAVAAGPLGGGPVLWPALVRYPAGHHGFWPVVAALLELAGLAATASLLAQVRDAAHRRLPAVDGPTRMLTRAAGRDLRRRALKVPGVRDARLRFTGTRARPRLVMTVTCPTDAPLAEVCAALREGPVARYREAVGLDGLVVVLRFTLEYQQAKLL